MKKNFIPVVKHFCFKCDSKLVKEKELDYPFFCEENMFTFETRIIKYKKFKRKFKNSLKKQD